MSEGVRVSAIFFSSSKPEELARFYQLAFDFGPMRAVGEGQFGLGVDGLYLGFEPVHDIAPTKQHGVTVWFSVPDTDTAYQHLLSLGALPESPPDPDCSPGEILATVRDPAGNVVGLIGPNPPMTHENTG